MRSGAGAPDPFAATSPRIGACVLAGRFLAREDGRRLAEGADRDHPDAGHQARLVPVVERSDDPRDPEVPREDRLGEGAADRTNGAVEREFPRDHPPGQRLSRQDAFGAQHRQGDRQVEKGAVLPQIGRREVDGDLPAGEGESGVAHGGTDPVVAFPDRASGEPDDGVGGQPVGDVGLDFHGNRVDPEHGEGEGANEQGGNLLGGVHSGRWTGVTAEETATGVPGKAAELRRPGAGDRAPEPVRQAERLLPRLRGERRRAEAVPVVQAEEAGGVLRKVGT